MAKWRLKTTRNKVYQSISFTALFIILVSVILFLFNQINFGYSFFIGGIAWILPNLYFAHKVFIEMRPQQSRQIVRNFYLGEFSKIVLTGIIFIVSVKLLPLSIVSFLTGFIFAQIVFWLIASNVK